MATPLASLVQSDEQLTLGGKPVRIRKITVGDLMRLLALVDVIKGKLGLSRDDITAAGSGKEGFMTLLSNLLQGSRADLMFEPAPEAASDDPDDFAPEIVARIRPGTTTDEVFGTLASLIGRRAIDLVASDPDELFAVGARFWEVNSSGPLGQKIRHTIATWAPELTALKDLTLANLQMAATTARRSGGTPTGGTTGSSDPSETPTDGPTPTFTPSEPDVASPSSPASATRQSDEQPPTAAPQQAEPALAIELPRGPKKSKA